MAEIEEIKTESKAAEETPVQEKKGFFGNLKAKAAEKKADREAKKAAKADEPKKTFCEKLKENKGKIAMGVGGAIAIGLAIGKVMARKEGEKGPYDPEWETEPGDYELDELVSAEEASEEAPVGNTEE